MKKKLEILEKIRKMIKDLALEYDTNLKIELNVNKKDDIIRINITEYNL